MPYTYTIEDRIVHLAWSGVVAKEDLQAIGREMPRLAAELGFAPDVLHTFDAVAGYSFQPIAAYALSLLRKRVVIPYPVRSAAVARTPESLALARIFIALNRTRNLTMEVFDSEEKARRWIAAKPVGTDERTIPGASS
ncbi:MAG: hypothetical protein IPL39_04370 [Opitutaceae bacterium]|nr:hypothetical protein [Opitutaceae bacterium]